MQVGDEKLHKESFFHQCLLNFYHFLLTEDRIEKGNISSIRVLKIEEAFLQSILQHDKHKVKRYLMQKILKSKLKTLDEIHIICSKRLEEDTKMKQCLLQILQSIEKLHVTEILASNTMDKNDMKYMDKFVKAKKIGLSKLKILIAINDKADLNIDKIVEYIGKYKFVDILRMQNISKADYRYIQDKINAINEEYGTTIDVIQKRNIQSYHIYIINSNIDKAYFKEHYILRKQACYIYMKDPDSDELGAACKAYEKGKYEIETLFNRLGLSEEHFSKNKLGNYLLKNE